MTLDHPFHLDQEHALHIDFVNESTGPGTRIAVEMTKGAARQLVEAIQSALYRARIMAGKVDRP